MRYPQFLTSPHSLAPSWSARAEGHKPPLSVRSGEKRRA